MIINAQTIVVTLIIIAIASYFGLQFIRAFALSIAQENHDANLAMDTAAEQQRLKRERDADAAVASAAAKVAPLLTGAASEKAKASAPKGSLSTPSSPSSVGKLVTPSSGDKGAKRTEEV